MSEVLKVRDCREKIEPIASAIEYVLPNLAMGVTMAPYMTNPLRGIASDLGYDSTVIAWRVGPPNPLGVVFPEDLCYMPFRSNAGGKSTPGASMHLRGLASMIALGTALSVAQRAALLERAAACVTSDVNQAGATSSELSKRHAQRVVVKELSDRIATASTQGEADELRQLRRCVDDEFGYTAAKYRLAVASGTAVLAGALFAGRRIFAGK